MELHFDTHIRRVRFVFANVVKLKLVISVNTQQDSSEHMNVVCIIQIRTKLNLTLVKTTKTTKIQKILVNWFAYCCG